MIYTRSNDAHCRVLHSGSRLHERTLKVPIAFSTMGHLRRQGRVQSIGIELTDLYYFGIPTSMSMTTNISDLQPARHVWGFDSFTGLPEGSSEDVNISVWHKGAYGRTFRGNSPQTIERRFNGLFGGQSRCSVIPGMFSESLRPGLASELGMRPALYVDIDVDLFSSSYEALKFLFTNKLVAPGTVIFYDDYWVISRSKAQEGDYIDPATVGEGLAHTRITNEFGAQFACLAGPCRVDSHVSETPCNAFSYSRCCGCIKVAVGLLGFGKPDSGLDTFTHAELKAALDAMNDRGRCRVT